MPDAVAKRITTDIIAPYFKKGDFHGGITAGVERLIKVVEGEPLPEPAGKSQRSSREMEGHDFIVIGLIVVMVIVLIVVGRFLRAWLGRFGGSAVLGGATGGGVWAITGVAGYGIFVAIMLFILGLVFFGSRRGGSTSVSLWGSGGWSSGGGGWSGGGSGGSFSGGGGDFGGGGASGSW